MGIKIYISGISGNKEVKKRQQRVLMILDSKNIKYEVVDIAEPGNEDPKEFMQNHAKSFGATIGDANPRHPLPPQIFNDNDYCGDYDQFDMSNEIDEIEKFLKLQTARTDKTIESNAEIKLGNGEITHNQNDKEIMKEQKSEEGKAEDVPVEDKVAEYNSNEAAQGDVVINRKETEKNEEVEKNKDVEKIEEPEKNKGESEPNKDEELENHEADNAKVETESKEKLEDGNDLSETAAEA